MLDPKIISEKIASLFEKTEAICGSALSINGYRVRFLGLHHIPHLPGWQIEMHHHRFYEFHYVLDGWCVTTAATRVFQIEPAQFCLMGPGLDHAHQSPDGHEGFSLRFTIEPEADFKSGASDRLQSLHYFLCHLAEMPFFPISDPDYRYARQLISRLELVENAPLIQQQLIVFSWMTSLQSFHEMNDLDLSMSAVVETLTHTEIVNRCIEYIEKHFAEPVSMNQIAEAVHLSYGHISRVFRKITGMTMNEYLTMTRLKKAQYELRASRKSIREISEKCGFSHENYFSNLFKKRYGLSPLAYRRSHSRLIE